MRQIALSIYQAIEDIVRAIDSSDIAENKITGLIEMLKRLQRYADKIYIMEE